jgi:hypothetical protein
MSTICCTEWTISKLFILLKMCNLISSLPQFLRSSNCSSCIFLVSTKYKLPSFVTSASSLALSCNFISCIHLSSTSNHWNSWKQACHNTETIHLSLKDTGLHIKVLGWMHEILIMHHIDLRRVRMRSCEVGQMPSL